jgi:translation initiation factor IF-2
LEDIDDLIKDEEEEKGLAGGKPSKDTEIGYLHHSDAGDEDTEEEDSDSGAVFIGTVEYFFSKISVAAIRLTGSLKIGDVIGVRDGDEVVRLTVSSMQIEKEDVAEADEGDSVGIKTEVPLNIGSRIYRIAD